MAQACHPEIGRERQEDHKFQGSLDYVIQVLGQLELPSKILMGRGEKEGEGRKGGGEGNQWVGGMPGTQEVFDLFLGTTINWAGLPIPIIPECWRLKRSPSSPGYTAS